MHIRRTDSRRIIASTVLFAFVCTVLFYSFGLAGLYPALVLVFAAMVTGFYKLYRQLEYDNSLVVNEVASLNAIRAIAPELSLLPQPSGWTASPALLREIVEHVRRRQPAVVVELGSGLSTLYFATMMKDQGVGHVYSLEHDEAYAQESTGQIQSNNLHSFATVIPVPLKSRMVDGDSYMWYDVESAGLPEQIDILLVDGPPRQTQPLARYPALPVLESRLAPDAVVILDDSDRQDEQAILDMWLSRYPSFTLQEKFCRKGLAVLTRQPPEANGNS